LKSIGKVVWFTGLSGSGKTTLALALSKVLNEKNIKNVVLDGDVLRAGLSSDLGFKDADRKENIRRAKEISKLLVEQGYVVIVALISPFREDRDEARKSFQPGNFVEVFCSADFESCKARDVKGLYKAAIKGELTYFTGINSIYEPSNNPEVNLNITSENIDLCIKKIMYCFEKNLIKK
jgi:adenylylsulfate kinase